MISHTSEQQFAIGITFALFTSLAWSADRTWTDATGEFSVIAELVAVRGNKGCFVTRVENRLRCHWRSSVRKIRGSLNKASQMLL